MSQTLVLCPQSPSASATLPRPPRRSRTRDTRALAEGLLREVAFVLHATRAVKEQLLGKAMPN
jgi:hypothetical protein